MTLKRKSKQYIKNYVDEAIFKEIRNALESLDYGTVTITIHSGRTMQIEVARKNVWITCGALRKGRGYKQLSGIPILISTNCRKALDEVSLVKQIKS